MIRKDGADDRRRGLDEAAVVAARAPDGDPGPRRHRAAQARAGDRRRRAASTARWSSGCPSSPTSRSPARTGRWVYVSPQIEAMFGYPAQEWLDDPTLWARLVHPDDQRARVRRGRAPAARRAHAGRSSTGCSRARVRCIWISDDAVLRPEPEDGRLAARRPAVRHHRPQGRRVAAAAPGRPRRADGPAEPPPLHRGPDAGARADPARAARELGRGGRRRQLQGRQRLARPPRRRPADPQRREPAGRAAARGGHDRAAGRRRVRGAAARHHRRARAGRSRSA